ncbi:hypothetical protein [Aliiroseovarius crassostreae]|uniref:hypothetical protein n=1 Tax=Aliiroseovarius crassostreae TaxID=154981 RepID=UPI003C7A5DF8
MQLSRKTDLPSLEQIETALQCGAVFLFEGVIRSTTMRWEVSFRIMGLREICQPGIVVAARLAAFFNEKRANLPDKSLFLSENRRLDPSGLVYRNPLCSYSWNNKWRGQFRA